MAPAFVPDPLTVKFFALMVALAWLSSDEVTVRFVVVWPTSMTPVPSPFFWFVRLATVTESPAFVSVKVPELVSALPLSANVTLPAVKAPVLLSSFVVTEPLPVHVPALVTL